MWDILFALLCVLLSIRVLSYIRYYFTAQRKNTVTVGVFHPYCNAGGGGERVLWLTVQELLKLPNTAVVIYALDTAGTTTDKAGANESKNDKTGVVNSDDEKSNRILKKAEERFGVTVPATSIRFIFLRTGNLLSASSWPRFTLLGQSLGSMIVACETLWRHCPDVWLDTMGYAFTYPIARLLCGCKVGCYVHYPTISSDMLQRVYERRPAYNNDALVAGSVVSSCLKYVYYKMFALLYRVVGRFSYLTMVNSSWTRNHIDALWGSGCQAKVVFPPCDITVSTTTKKTRSPCIVSVGQFRPEKNHKLQLMILVELRKLNKLQSNTKLKLIGSCRGIDDMQRVEELKEMVIQYGLQDNVEFLINISYMELKEHLATSLIGIHTMWCEHFGIGVVEMLAAGLITIAHDSGGPKTDIIVVEGEQRTGYLATTAVEYAECVAKVLEDSNLDTMRERALNSVKRFSDEVFRKSVSQCLKLLVS